MRTPRTILLNVIDISQARFHWPLVFALLLTLGCGSEKQSVERAIDIAETQAERPVPKETQDRNENPTSTTGVPTDHGSVVTGEAPESPMQRVRQLVAEQRLDESVIELRKILVKNPTDYEAIYLLAHIQATQGDLDSAIESLQMIPATKDKTGLSALALAANVAFQKKDYSLVEIQLRKILELEPGSQQARRQLIQLLNIQGRRHEAVLLTRELCLSGDINEFELRTLILEADVIYRPPSQQAKSGVKHPTLVGRGGKARFLSANAYFDEAVSVLEKHIESGKACPSDIALCGAAIAESQQVEKFDWWLQQTGDTTQAFPEYWAAVGAHLLLQGEFKGAIRALGEAILRDPTDVRSVRRMSKAFYSIGDSKAGDQWMARYENLVGTYQAMPFDVQGNPKSIQDSGQLIRSLENLGRQLEAIHWRAIFAAKDESFQKTSEDLMAERRKVIEASESFPSPSKLLCGINLSDFALPENLAIKRSRASTPPSNPNDLPPVPAKFTNVAKDVGIQHAYRIHTTDRKRAFAIHQTFGGGVAVLDFDLDAAPDLYFCQGFAKSPQFVAKGSDVLYRNVSGGEGHLKVADVTIPAWVNENAYTLGATAGDWNQDGFLDLVISNIGPDYLLINQGDGSFSRTCLNLDDRHDRLSTSVAMADLDGDNLPDIFQLNYLEDSKMANRPPRDELGRAKRTAAPHTFRHALDCVWMNDGQGGWTHEEVGESETHRSTGLGVVVGDLDPHHPGNEVYVANDEQADHLWKFDQQKRAWQESALPAGCAFGSLGFQVGSMGIAAADFDQSGSLDLHVTTFSQESSCHFLNASGFFQDASVRHGIDRVSTMFMGFGCQAIDPGNRGVWDMVITNGHVEDLQHQGKLFQQPIQLIVSENGKYTNAAVEDPSGFWSTGHLGRALAKLDFDRDGRQDFVTTDLLGPSGLLINGTDSDHHWVKTKLVGSVSERDAVGARVEIQASGKTWTQWITSGDGYLCRNENCLHFGVGEAKKIDRIDVQWPSGETQSFRNLSVDQEYLLIESADDVWPPSTTPDVP